MDLSFSKEEMAFREEVRTFFRDNVPAETRRKLVEGRHLSKQEMVDWWRILNRKGWGVSHWPKEYGGTGWSSVQHYIFNEELQAFRQNQLATMFMWGSAYRGAAVDPATTTLKPEEVGIQVMPVGSVSAGTHRGIWSGVISKRTPHPAAAWRFLQWLSSKDGERLSANATGSFPARRSTLAATPDNTWQVPVFATLRQAYDLAEAGKMWRPRLAKSDAVQQILADEVALATAGDNSPKDALKRAADRIDRLRL